MLHARLRLPPKMPDAEKKETVRRLIAELGLKNVADSPVGRVGTFHHVILQSKHTLMTASRGMVHVSPCNQSDTRE